MDSPFIYNRQVTGKSFLGRKEDCNVLSNLLQHGENIALYSPPKTGKRSLIQQTLMKIRITGFQFTVGEFSLLNIRKREDFLVKYGSTVLRTVAVSPDEFASLVRKYLGDTHFVFDPIVYQSTDNLISSNWELDENDVTAMLSLPFRLCQDKGIHLILILNEFQCVMQQEEDGERLCYLFGKVLEQYRNDSSGAGRCRIVFCGSMVNAMHEIFHTRNWFYRLVERIQPSPLDEKEIVDYINRGFMLAGKEIDRNLLLGVCRLFKCHPWYINHYMAICDSLSRGYIVESMLMDGLKSLLAIHEPRFYSIMNGLTSFQVNLLQAILDGHSRVSSNSIIKKYNLNSSANVKRLREALMKKEIITFNDKEEAVLEDPFFEYWVRKYYFDEK